MSAQYAIYKGDEYLCGGTRRQCADYLGTSPDTVTFLSTPTYRRRLEKRRTSTAALLAIKVQVDK